MIIDYDDLTTEKLAELISSKKTFEVIGLSGRMGDAVKFIEQHLEDKGLRCRIYTYGRFASAGATLFGGVTGFIGFASVVGMASHNLATFNPNYEIAKHLVDNKLTITRYK